MWGIPDLVRGWPILINQFTSKDSILYCSKQNIIITCERCYKLLMLLFFHISNCTSFLFEGWKWTPWLPEVLGPGDCVLLLCLLLCMMVSLSSNSYLSIMVFLQHVVHFHEIFSHMRVRKLRDIGYNGSYFRHVKGMKIEWKCAWFRLVQIIWMMAIRTNKVKIENQKKLKWKSKLIQK